VNQELKRLSNTFWHQLPLASVQFKVMIRAGPSGSHPNLQSLQQKMKLHMFTENILSWKK
jgi:hypothetical protein